MSSPNVMASVRDSERLDSLSRAISEIRRHDDGQLGVFVLEGVARIWTEVVDLGHRYLLHDDHSRRASEEAASRTFLSQMDQEAVDQFIDALNRVDLNNDQAVLNLSRKAIRALREQFTSIYHLESDGRIEVPPLTAASGDVLDSRAQVASWRSQLQLLAGSVDSLLLLHALRDRSQETLAEARLATSEGSEAAVHLERIRHELATAKAERAQGQLAREFAALSEREGRTGWGLRLLTLVLLAAAVAAGIAVPSGASWSETLGHLAVVATIGGAAAYTARLAANHRSVSDWARSVEVQLATFQDFLGAIDDAPVKNRLYEDFGRRVLGPPPSGVGDDGSSVPTANIVELARAIADPRGR